MIKERLIGLDVFKGWAILFMMVYHISFDLNYFHFISIHMQKDFFWVQFRYLIVAMFLFSVGINLYFVHSPHIKWSKMYKRTFILGFLSLIITVATYFVFPKSWVYFGILHFILLASWMGIVFLPYPRLSLLTAFAILVGSALGWLQMHWLFNMLKIPLHLPPRFTEDLLQPFPWFAAVLLGLVFTHYGLAHKVFKLSIFTKHNTFHNVLSFLGRHALLVYLLHLPLFFGLFMLLNQIMH